MKQFLIALVLTISAFAQNAQPQLTDAQKEDYKRVIVPLKNEGIKAMNSVGLIDSMFDKIEKTPSGFFSGAFASTVGRLYGSDANTALRELKGLQEALVTQIPRTAGRNPTLMLPA